MSGSTDSLIPDWGGLRGKLIQRRTLLYLVLGLLLIAFLLPLESGIVTSFKSREGYLATNPVVPPTPDIFSLGPWETAWDTLKSNFINSAMYAVPATILSALLGSLAAHGLTSLKWRGQTAVFLIFAAGIFIPYQSVLIPLSRFWFHVGLQDGLANLGPLNVWQLPFMKPHYAQIIELILTHTAYGIPITTLLFRGHYQAISGEMLESARLAGAGMIAIYREIILPLSKPMFIVTFIYQFTSIWNGLLVALILAPTGPAQPITVAINELAIVGMVPTYNTMMAGAFITALPTLVVYIFFGDRFAEGVAGYGQAQ